MGERHSYDFILGECGSGKSYYAYHWLLDEAAEHPERRYFLFVPEQNSLKAQRQIMEMSSCHGMLNLDILSFQLLFYRISDELGLERPVLLDDMTKTLLLRKAAIDAMSEGEISIYGSGLSSRGFISRIRTLVSEFSQYNIDIEKLKAMAGAAGDRQLKGKLDDIIAIYSRFLSYLNVSGTIPEELPGLLLKYIGRSSLLDNAVIVFDGYTGFTPVQLELIKHILSKASLCRFTVAIPPEEDPYRFDKKDLSDIYWLSRRTIANIIDAASGVSAVQAKGRHTAIKERERAVDGITVIEARDPADEIRRLAGDIRRRAVICRKRYNRMAVLLSDPESYAELVKREFTRAGIPYFMDDKAAAIGSPAIELIRAALAMITGGCRYDDIMRYMKNVLLTVADGEEEPVLVDRTEIYEFDNFLRRSGIRGRRALERALGERASEGLVRLTGSVFALQDRLKAAPTICDKNKALEAFMEEVRLRERLYAMAAELDNSGFKKEAAENTRFMELIGQLIQNLTAVLGSEKASMKDYAALLDAGFIDMKGSLIPETMDMVIVGDLKRSRLDDIDILYIVGANDGLLPHLVSGGGIFTDRERLELGRLDEDFPEALRFELAPDDRTDTSIQEFYLYSAMHKPSEELIVSYASTGRDARTLRISAAAAGLISSGARLVRTVDSDPENLSMVITRYDAMDALATLTGARSEGAAVRGLYKALSADPETAQTAERIIEASYFDYKKDSLSEQAAAALYGRLLIGSVSRIEAYEACPYSHFLKYGLRLKERESFDLEAADIGNLFHAALDEVLRNILSSGRELAELTDRELNLLAGEAVARVTSEYGGSERSMLSSARNHAVRDRVVRITERTLSALRFQAARGAFRTLGTEVRFSVREKGLVLSGSIDRLDCCTDPVSGRTLVKVLDYKTGGTKFDMDLCLNGLRMQLCAYMDCALSQVQAAEGSAEPAVPAGMFYYHINDPVIDYDKVRPQAASAAKAAEAAGSIEVVKQNGTSDNADESSARAALTHAANLQALAQLRIGGVVTDDPAAVRLIDDSMDGAAAVDSKTLKKSLVMAPGTLTLSEKEFRRLLELTRGRLRRDASAILSGDIEVKPYKYGSGTGCDYCAYSGICGFDPGDGDDYRRIRKSEGKDGLE